MTKNTQIVLGVVIGATLLFGGIYFYKQNDKTPSDEIVKKAEKTIENEKKNPTKDVYITAQKAYEISKSYAKKWANDATFIEITNYAETSKTDGTSDSWKVKYYSPSKNKSYSIYVIDGKFKRDDEGGPTSLTAITDTWLDSDKVMKNAIESFKDVECESYWMGLSSDGWTIKCNKPKTIENKWVSINATTGEKIKEWTGD